LTGWACLRLHRQAGRRRPTALPNFIGALGVFPDAGLMKGFVFVDVEGVLQ